MNTDSEVWEPIPGWPAYECSSRGRVRSVDHTIHDPRGFTRTWRGRLLRVNEPRGPRRGGGGPRVTLSDGDRRTTFYINSFLDDQRRKAATQ